MKVDYTAPMNSTATDAEASDIQACVDFEGLWLEAADSYFAEFKGKLAAGKARPKGMQRHLNEVIESRLLSTGWEGSDGRFVRDDRWLRVSFRHRMSLGSDLFDATRMVKVEGAKQAIIVSATKDFLDQITPLDAGALCSAEDFRLQSRLAGSILNIPLVLGALVPVSTLPIDIQEVVSSPERRKR